MDRLSPSHPKIRYLMARGYTLGNAQIAVKKAEEFATKAAAEAQTQAARESALSSLASSPFRNVSVRARARQIQAQKNCTLGPAILQAEREREVARALAERAVKTIARNRVVESESLRAPAVTLATSRMSTRFASSPMQADPVMLAAKAKNANPLAARVAPAAAPKLTPVAPLPLANKGKARLLSSKAERDDDPPILMINNPSKVLGK